jgi:hypothetical protein
MSQLHLSDEILMAFADGELDEPAFAAVAKAIAEDPVVAKRVVDFQQSRRLTRSALSSTLESDVPPALRAAVSAQVEAYETANTPKAESNLRVLWYERRVPKNSAMQVALAASLAAVALGLGYFAGSQGISERHGLIAQLESSPVRDELNRAASGKDVELPFGRLRVISTYRLASGSLCREFRLQSSMEAAEAVACHKGEWMATFALAKATNDTAFTPSGGDDPMAAYLESIGADQPLVDEAETKALAGTAR